MLVCSRKPGEAVMIGDDIEVVILAIHEGRVKLGFLAPREGSVHRLEIWKREIEGGKASWVEGTPPPRPA